MAHKGQRQLVRIEELGDLEWDRKDRQLVRIEESGDLLYSRKDKDSL